MHHFKLNIYSKSMKTQHLYFRCISNMDLSIKILFSSDNFTLHFLSKDHSLYWLVVNMHCLKVLVKKTSYPTPCNFPHEWFVFLHRAFLGDWVDNIFPTSKCQYMYSISKYSKIKSEKNWSISELVAAVSWKVIICPVYKPLLHFICTWHWYKN